MGGRTSISASRVRFTSTQHPHLTTPHLTSPIQPPTAMATATVRQVYRSLNCDDYVLALAWDPDGTYLAATLRTGGLVVYDTGSGRLEKRVDAQCERVRGGVLCARAVQNRPQWSRNRGSGGQEEEEEEGWRRRRKGRGLLGGWGGWPWWRPGWWCAQSDEPRACRGRPHTAKPCASAALHSLPHPRTPPRTPLHPTAPPPSPQVDYSSLRRHAPSWHPDGGSVLAVPVGAEGDVALHERLSWEATGYLSGEHRKAVNIVAFSPNGGSGLWQFAGGDVKGRSRC